jgi:hypothetical protein
MVKFTEFSSLSISKVTENLHPSPERTHFFSPTLRSGVGYSLSYAAVCGKVLVTNRDCARLSEVVF